MRTTQQSEMQAAANDIESAVQALAAGHKRFTAARTAHFEGSRSDGGIPQHELVARQEPVSDQRLAGLIADRLFTIGLSDVVNRRHSGQRLGPLWTKTMTSAIEALP